MLYYTDKYFLGLGEMCISLKNPKFHYACHEGGTYCAVIMGYSTFRYQYFSPNIDSVQYCSSPTGVALVLSQVHVSL